MEKVTKEVAEKKLEPHSAKIQDCILMGIKEYRTEYSKFLHIHSCKIKSKPCS